MILCSRGVICERPLEYKNMTRDNFSRKTIDTLAQRVGFLCSNPACKAHTVGPNSQPNKATRIGKAAHISAAALGGPRYNQTLSASQRSDINNGIWLCSNCSDLVDKDEYKYPVEVLSAWKILAEMESAERIKGGKKANDDPFSGPFLEADLIRDGTTRLNNGYSDKNSGQMENGVYVIEISNKPIIHWVLTWKLKLIIYNNSSYPAYNVSVNPISEIQIITRDTLPKVNNLQPFANNTLKITYQERLEDRHMEADRRFAMRIPEGINGMNFEIIYLDDQRIRHRTLVQIDGQNIINTKG